MSEAYLHQVLGDLLEVVVRHHAETDGYSVVLHGRGEAARDLVCALESHGYRIEKVNRNGRDH